MKRLLTHSQLKHTKQAANKFLTCFIAAIMAVALSLPAAGIPTLSFADEPNQGSGLVSSTGLEQGDGESDQINDSEGEKSDSSSNGNGAESDNGVSSELANGSNANSHVITDVDIALDESTFNKYEYNGIGLDPAIQAEQNANGANEASISTQSLPAGFDLEPYVVSSIDPANTKVNLFNYSNGWGTAADDRYKSWEWTGATIAQRYQNIFGNPNGKPNINRGHLLAFGDSQTVGMGYWNFGAGAARGLFAYQYPGMQFMTQGHCRTAIQF